MLVTRLIIALQAEWNGLAASEDLGEETAANDMAAERLRDIRTTRDRIERDARTNSGELG